MTGARQCDQPARYAYAPISAQTTTSVKSGFVQARFAAGVVRVSRRSDSFVRRSRSLFMVTVLLVGNGHNLDNSPYMGQAGEHETPMNQAPSAIGDDDTPKLVRRVRLRWDAVRGAHVLLYPEGFLVLNDSAAEVLQRCNGAHTVRELVRALAAEHPEVAPGALADDVRAVLARVRDRGFLTLDAGAS